MQASSGATAFSRETMENKSFRIIGKRGRQRGQFSNPQDVLFMHQPQSTTLLVSDTINQNVQMFSVQSGACTGILSSSNPKHLPLRRPIGLSSTIEPSSSCLVADYDQHCLSSWTIDSENNSRLIKKFGQQHLLGPKGVSQFNRIVVADNKANAICVFDHDGTFLHRFGNRGAQAHELAGPHYVRFAEKNDERTIFVTDFYNNAVKLFDLERQGQLISCFGSLGTKNGCFQAPTGLAIDYERGYLFVADWGNQRIQLFDRQGTFIRLIDLTPTDSLYGPQGLDYDAFSRTLAVANSGKHSALLIHID